LLHPPPPKALVVFFQGFSDVQLGVHCTDL
jgi:hypothetical protein